LKRCPDLQRLTGHNLPQLRKSGYVAVENIFVIVVLGLDYLVARTKLPAKFLNDRLISAGWVQFILEPDVQFAYA
jgi:hypothetical protein